MLTLALALLLQSSTPAPTCVIPDGTRLQLEVALTDQQKRVGLMHRDKLAPDAGMVFVFDRDDILPFWMKDTLIPLDIIWLSASGEVVELRADLQPCRVDPCPKSTPVNQARAALLVNAGFTAAHKLTPGAVLRFESVPGLGRSPAAK